MNISSRLIFGLRIFTIFAALLAINSASALTPEAARAIAVGENDDRIKALAAALEKPDAELSRLLDALLNDSAKIAGDKVLIVTDGKAFDATTSAETALPATAEDVINNNRMRREIEGAKASLGLFSDSVTQRNNAITELKDSADEAKLPLIDKALAQETDPSLKAKLEQLRAAMLIASSDKQKRLTAVAALTNSGQPSVRSLMQERLNAGGETDPDVRAALTAGIKAIEGKLVWGERLGVIFTGVSLGSILFLVALGLAITYGLMGVINMAHGELLMIGAYATYLVQNLFRKYLPGAFDYYIIAAIPLVHGSGHRGCDP
jgi:urea transport system permease protein